MPTRGFVAALAALLLAGLVGCALPGAGKVDEPVVSLPLRLAWFEGRQVEYISTDTSDAGMARMMGINHVPLLAAAAAPAGSPPGTRTAIDRVYMFPGGEQLNVFPSAPVPAGPDNANRAYSPLWLVVMARWAPGRQARELRSEEAVLDAAERGELQLERTAIVVNCPVVRSADGRGLTGLR